MMGSTHRLFGAALAGGIALAVGMPLLAIPGAALAAVTAAGKSSPDLDQCRAWRSFDEVVPDELLGGGGPLQHRGILHWWGLPAAAGVYLWPYTAGPARLALAALLIGWWSHLLGDFLFGKAGYGRPAGIPFGPWFWHAGVGLDVDGWVEDVVRVALAGACCLLVITSVRDTGPLLHLWP